MRKSLAVNLSENITWILVIVVAFLAVYAFSLTFVSIDGDHSSALTYHLVERNTDLQRPYFFYHGMMDVILSIVPANYDLIQTFSLGITAFAAIILVILIIILVFDWMEQLEISPKSKGLIVLVLLLASPEYFFFGLIYNPTAIAMSLVILAHLLMRSIVKNTKSEDGLSASYLIIGLISAILFGLGTSFRWNIGLYGAIIFADIVILHFQLHQVKFARDGIGQFVRGRFSVYVGWGIIAVVSAVLAIFASGYNIDDIVLQLSDVENAYEGIGVETLKNLLPFFTPAFVVMALVGFVALLKQKSALIVVILVGWVLMIPIFVSGVPKQLLPAIPGAILCAAIGFQVIWNGLKSQYPKYALRIVLITILVAPWLIGVSIVEEDAQYGIWFEAMSYERDVIDDEGVVFHLGAGRAYNTPEGFRPLFGYGFVLFGEWRPFLQDFDLAYDAIVQQSIDMNLPIVVTQFPISYEVNRLLELGFTTESQEYDLLAIDNKFTERIFTNDAGQSITVIFYEIHYGEPIEELDDLTSLVSLYDTVIWRGYMHTLHHAYLSVPSALIPIAPNAAIFDLNQLDDILAGG